jgi:hypothetical protein
MFTVVEVLFCGVLCFFGLVGYHKSSKNEILDALLLFVSTVLAAIFAVPLNILLQQHIHNLLITSIIAHFTVSFFSFGFLKIFFANKKDIFLLGFYGSVNEGLIATLAGVIKGYMLTSILAMSILFADNTYNSRRQSSLINNAIFWYASVLVKISPNGNMHNIINQTNLQSAVKTMANPVNTAIDNNANETIIAENAIDNIEVSAVDSIKPNLLTSLIKIFAKTNRDANEMQVISAILKKMSYNQNQKIYNEIKAQPNDQRTKSTIDAILVREFVAHLKDKKLSSTNAEQNFINKVAIDILISTGKNEAKQNLAEKNNTVLKKNIAIKSKKATEQVTENTANKDTPAETIGDDITVKISETNSIALITDMFKNDTTNENTTSDNKIK